MVVEDVHVGQAHALQTLVQRGEDVFARAPLAVGAGPHQIAGLGRDDELVAVRGEVLAQEAAEVLLGRAGRRAVVVGQVEMSEAEVERAAEHRALVADRVGAAKVVPQAQREPREFEAAAAATGILDRLVTPRIGIVAIHKRMLAAAAAVENENRVMLCRLCDKGIWPR